MFSTLRGEGLNFFINKFNEIYYIIKQIKLTSELIYNCLPVKELL